MTQPTAEADPLRQAAIVIRRLKERLERAEKVEKREREAIAIVGIACRFPGGAHAPGAFWQLLDEGRDAVGTLEARWAAVGSRPADHVPGWAGVIEGIEHFDAAFFGVSPREAMSLDPQHRLLLEVAWEALEDAGIVPSSLDGSRTGVFLGACTTDYLHLMAQVPAEQRDVYGVTGNMLSVAAGRLAYTLGLQGPCLTVDTACSSSLVAVHLACKSLRGHESDTAVVGGVNVILSPATMESLARTQALSPDGRCHTFDASANGYVRGEGCGVVILKRLSDAERDGDRVWALIKGSAVNQDGRSTGLTTPNVLAQQVVLRDALASAGVAAEAVSFVETHGTGTSLGDPIEIEALRAVLGKPRVDGSLCALGALKTNLGHLEGAAGIAGLIKVALALRHERIPGNLHLRTLNPRIRMDDSALTLSTQARPWPRADAPRIAGVSAFGLSGTNAHVILAEAPARVAPAAHVLPAAPRAVQLVVLSAKDASALDAAAGRLRDHLLAHPELSVGDVAFSLATTRETHPRRLAFAAPSRELLCQQLQAASQGTASALIARGEARGRGKVAFLFAGQGSQTSGMGQGLYQEWPAFRASLDQCAALLSKELGRSLLELMWSEPEQLQQTVHAQPALFALELALVELWRSWGVAPDVVVGHSVGELAAACAAGVFSLEDGCRLVAARGRLMQELQPGGAMISIAAPESEVAAALLPYAAQVSLAALNGPRSVVISGEALSARAIAAEFAQRGVRIKELAVSHAFHSPQMEPMLEKFRVVAESVRFSAPRVPLVNNITGALAGAEVAAAAHWVQHARAAVRFADGVRAAAAVGASTFIELGPKATLLGLVPACLPEMEPGLIASLRSDRPEATSILQGLGAWFCRGGAIRWAGVFAGANQRVQLPTYPWVRARHWVDVKAQDHPASRASPRRSEGLLGERVSTPLAALAFASSLAPSARGGALSLRLFAMAIEAARITQGASVALRELHISSAALDDAAGVSMLHTSVQRGRDHRSEVAIHGQSAAADAPWLPLLTAVGGEHARPVESSMTSSAAIVELDPQPGLTGEAPPLMSPEAIEACLRLAWPTGGARAITSCRELFVWAAIPGRFACQVTRRELDVDLLLSDMGGAVLARMEGVCTVPAPSSALDPAVVLETLRGLVAQVLIDGGPVDDEDTDLLSAGLGSLALLELLRSIETAFAVKIPTRQFFARGEITLRQLQRLILEGDVVDETAPSASMPWDASQPPPVPTPTAQRYAEVFGGTGLASTLWTFTSGLALELVDVGDGPCTLLLPPIGCELVVWKPFIERIAASRRVLALNVPGFGQAPFRAESIEGLAAAIAAIIEQTKVGALDIVGWSFGGFVAQVLAASAPASVRSLTLVNTTSHLAFGSSLEDSGRLLSQLTEDFSRDLADSEIAAEAERLVFWGREARASRVWGHYANLVGSFDFRAEAATIKAPTLVVGGERDLPVPSSHSVRSSEAIAGSRLVIVGGVGHYVPLFRAAEFSTLFLEHTSR